MTDAPPRLDAADRPTPRDLVFTTDDGVSFHLRAWDPTRRTRGPTEPAPFVLLHGIGANARLWDAAGRLLAASGRRAYALDFRGHGKSADGTAPFHVPDFADDVAAAIGALEFDRPIVAGHSLGGDVALELAAQRPELVGGLVLVDGGIAGGDSQFDSWEECERAIALPPVSGLPRQAVEGFLRSSHPDWSEERLAAAMASFDTHPNGTVDWRVKPEVFASLLRSLWVEPLSELWPRITAPVLALLVDTGNERWTDGKRRYASAAQAPGGIARLRVEWLTGEHDIHAACPEAVVSLMLDWLDGASVG